MLCPDPDSNRELPQIEKHRVDKLSGCDRYPSPPGLIPSRYTLYSSDTLCVSGINQMKKNEKKPTTGRHMTWPGLEPGLPTGSYRLWGSSTVGGCDTFHHQVLFTRLGAHILYSLFFVYFKIQVQQKENQQSAKTWPRFKPGTPAHRI